MGKTELSGVMQRLHEYLINKGIAISKAEKIMDMSNTALKKAFDRNSSIGVDKIETIVAKCPDLSPSWLLTGEGSMLRGESEEQVTPIHHPKYKERMITNEVIKLYDIDAAANLKTLMAEKTQNIIGEITVPNAPKCDGALYVRGDSMYPLLKSGDIVAYKEIAPELQNIFWGEMYVVDLDVDGDDYLVVKYVNHSDLGDDWIKLVSYNQYHQPKDFPLSSVRAMALVKLSIRMNTIK